MSMFRIGDVRVILPEGALGQIGDPHRVEDGLRFLTRVIVEKGLANKERGILGGEWGYGTEFENETFMMHPYCWCENKDCPWCCGCECPEDAYHYFIDGKEVTCDEWFAFLDQEVGPFPKGDDPQAQEEYLRRVELINKRRSSRHDPICDFCCNGGPGSAKGGLPGRPAPNFWHKPSGFRVWWYKWIGRDMEIENPNNVKWLEILIDCLKALPPEPSIIEGRIVTKDVERFQ